MGVGGRGELRIATLLAENTTAIVDQLARYLTACTEIPIGVTHPQSTDADLRWACGYLTVAEIQAGSLDHDIAVAPVFAGQSGATYHSVIVARTASGRRSLRDTEGATLAINEPISWSGHHGLEAHLSASSRSIADMYPNVVEAGSHHGSIAAVRDGTADVAAIDHTVWEFFETETDETAELTVVDTTQSWPAPPISLRRTLDQATRRALHQALVAVGPGDIGGLDAMVSASYTDYVRVFSNRLI